MLDRVLVVGHPQHFDPVECQVVQLVGVLTLRVMPEHHPLLPEVKFQVRLDRGHVTHWLASSPGIFFNAVPNLG